MAPMAGNTFGLASATNMPGATDGAARAPACVALTGSLPGGKRETDYRHERESADQARLRRVDRRRAGCHHHRHAGRPEKDAAQATENPMKSLAPTNVHVDSGARIGW